MSFKASIHADGYGQWSSKGCNTTISDGNVICYCNHLTNFAILLVVREDTLSIIIIIIIIGCVTKH